MRGSFLGGGGTRHSLMPLFQASVRPPMSDFSRLPLWAEDGVARIVVETAKGSRVKISYEPELSCFGMSRALPVGLAYPFDWGFLPSTLGEDGDPLDAMVIHDAKTAPGLVVPCHIVGTVKVKQKEQGKTLRNDRFIAVPVHETGAILTDARDLPKQLKFEIEKFFEASVIYRRQANLVSRLGGAQGSAQAHQGGRGGVREI
jgi:inorganic pyrophosphatase